MLSITPSLLFLFHDTATSEIYTLSLHDALPIYVLRRTRRLSGRGNAAEVGIADDRHGHLAFEEKPPNVLHQMELASGVRRVVGMELSRDPRRPRAAELVQKTRRVVRVGQKGRSRRGLRRSLGDGAQASALC